MAVEWTVDDVYEFVHRIGFTEAAELLKTNSIDGFELMSQEFEPLLTMSVAEGGIGLTATQKCRLMLRSKVV